MSVHLEFGAALTAFAQDPALGAGDLTVAFPRLVELAAHALAADGASIWEIEADGTLLVCRDRYDRRSNTHVLPEPIPSAELPRYMAHLQQTRVLNVPDAAANPFTAEIAARFAARDGVGALINVPLRRRNQIVGMLAVHSHTPRTWSDESAVFVATLGDFASLALAAHAQALVEAQLREERARVDLILSHADAVIFAVSPATGTFEYMSPAVRRFTDTPIDTVVGSNWQTIAHPDDLPVIAAEVQNVYEGRTERAQVQFRIPDNAGGWRWLNATTTLMRGADGHRRVIGVAQDITLERQRAREHAQLSLRVQEAQRLESIGRLAGGVAHDFNNLLTVILGGVDLAALQLGANPAQSLLGNVRSAAERAATLTRQLLAFSRRQALQLERLDVGEVLAGISALLRSSLPEHIACNIDIAREPCTVRADRAQLEQAIVAMTMNAAQSMPDGGTFELSLRSLRLLPDAPSPVRDAPAGDYVWLQLRDTGQGIAPDDIDHVFEPFFPTPAPTHGAGLGLAAVFGVVKQHQGYIDIESTQGVGTTFHILLPVLADHVREGRPASPVHDAGQRILVVEDEPAVRELTALILRQRGYRAETAEDVNDALRRVIDQGERYKLLITDVIMPGLNGVELHSRLRVADPALAVLYISGYAEDNLPAAIAPNALSSYLQKPFTLASLTDRVHALLAARADASA